MEEARHDVSEVLRIDPMYKLSMARNFYLSADAGRKAAFVNALERAGLQNEYVGAGMSDRTIRFDDGAAYEQMMGIWSRLVGEIFLDWLAPPRDCDGSMSAAAMARSPKLLVGKCEPSEVQVSIHRKGSLPLRVRGRLPAWQRSRKAMRWRFRLPPIASMPR